MILQRSVRCLKKNTLNRNERREVPGLINGCFFFVRVSGTRGHREVYKGEPFLILDLLVKKSMHVIPKSLRGKTIQYALNQWERLSGYVGFGHATPDNDLIILHVLFVRDDVIGFLQGLQIVPRSVLLLIFLSSRRK